MAGVTVAVGVGEAAFAGAPVWAISGADIRKSRIRKEGIGWFGEEANLKSQQFSTLLARP